MRKIVLALLLCGVVGSRPCRGAPAPGERPVPLHWRRVIVVCGGDHDRAKSALKEARKSVAEGAPSLDEAMNLQFLLLLYGYAEHRLAFASLYRVGVDPVLMAVAIHEIETAFGREETGNARQMLNKLIAASKTLQCTLDAFVLAAANSAPSVAKLGGTDEEFLAGLSVMTEQLEKEAKAAEETPF